MVFFKNNMMKMEMANGLSFCGGRWDAIANGL